MWKYKSDYHITDAGVCISKCFPALYQIFCGDVDICEDKQSNVSNIEEESKTGCNISSEMEKLSSLETDIDNYDLSFAANAKCERAFLSDDEDEEISDATIKQQINDILISDDIQPESGNDYR